MSWISGAAMYFILWWLTLFAVLPFGLKTQDEDGEVTLGTTSSAPRGVHMRWAIIRTTVVSATIFALAWAAIAGFDLGFEDIPRIVPDFR